MARAVIAIISASITHLSSARKFPPSRVHRTAFHHLSLVSAPTTRNNNIIGGLFMSTSAYASSRSTSETKRLVLIGGGHAHVQVIKALNAKARPDNVHVTLIDLQSSASYSGMVPGCVSKLYSFDQVQINLNSLAEWAGTEFICGKVAGMSLPSNDAQANAQKLIHVEVEDDTNRHAVVTKDIPFDVVSIDIGSTTCDFTTIPGASQYCISTRPISHLVRRIELEEQHLKEKIRTEGVYNCETKVVVVGGGAAGIELSLAMRARWGQMLTIQNNKDESTNCNLSITLLDSNDELMPGESLACRNALRNIMGKYNVEVHHNTIVTEVTSTHVLVATCDEHKNEARPNKEIAYTHCIWATGAQAHQLSRQLNEQCGLATSDRGWIQVNKYLQSISHPYVFAAGDCSELINTKSPPKAGVFAVRAGPILVPNLMRSLNRDDAVTESDYVRYIPQDDFLKLLMCGDGTALGFRFGIPLYGKWVWELKNHIDLMFMNLFDVNKLKRERQKKGEYDTSQYDAQSARPTKLNSEDAARLLLRTDDDVNFNDPWNVLRDMITDDEYKEEVLRVVSRFMWDKNKI